MPPRKARAPRKARVPRKSTQPLRYNRYTGPIIPPTTYASVLAGTAPIHPRECIATGEFLRCDMLGLSAIKVYRYKAKQYVSAVEVASAIMNRHRGETRAILKNALRSPSKINHARLILCRPVVGGQFASEDWLIDTQRELFAIVDLLPGKFALNIARLQAGDNTANTSGNHAVVICVMPRQKSVARRIEVDTAGAEAADAGAQAGADDACACVDAAVDENIDSVDDATDPSAAIDNMVAAGTALDAQGEPTGEAAKNAVAGEEIQLLETAAVQLQRRGDTEAQVVGPIDRWLR